MEEVERAYIAGFFDGEGHTSYVNCGLRGLISLQIGITNTKIEVLEYIRDKVGCGQVYTFVRGKDDKAKNMNYIRFTNGNDMIKFADYILPYVRLNRIQLEIVKLFYESIRTRGNNPRFSAAVKEMLSDLNKKGKLEEE